MSFNRIKIDSILLFQIGPVWLFLNLIMAFTNSNSLSLALIGLRDSWLFGLIILLFLKKQWEYLVFFYLSALLGLLPILWSISDFSLSIYLYGLRDIGLILFIFCIVNNKIESSPKIIRATAIVIIFGALLQIIVQLLLGDEIFQSISNANNYFSNKGIESNLKGGFFGDRIYYPLYSSSLVGTFLSIYFFTKKKIFVKVTILIIAVLTLSKAILVLFFFYFLKNDIRTRVVILICLLTFLLPPLIQKLLLTLEPSILSFHLASILDRFNAFNYLDELLFKLPDYLGFNSVAGYVLSGRDASLAPESLIIARLLDYKQFTFFIIIASFPIFHKMSKYQLNTISPIFFLLLFSSLSNHPIAFLPLILLSKKNRN